MSNKRVKKSVWSNHSTMHLSTDGYFQATINAMAEDKNISVPQAVKLIAYESSSFNKYFEGLVAQGLFSPTGSFYEDCKKKKEVVK